MSVLAIIAIVIGVLAVIFFIGGLVYSRRRLRSPEWEEHVKRADAQLERARAEDRGWDRVLMEEVARKALAERRSGWDYDHLHLVLVDDRPGVAEDTAQFVAVGRDGDAHVTLVRDETGWRADKVD
jgi:hypothetical protein